MDQQEIHATDEVTCSVDCFAVQTNTDNISSLELIMMTLAQEGNDSLQSMPATCMCMYVYDAMVVYSYMITSVLCKQPPLHTVHVLQGVRPR